MTQLNLLGEETNRYLCIKCSWTGTELKDYAGIKACPKCEWACYREDKADRVASIYPVLEAKLKKLRGR